MLVTKSVTASGMPRKAVALPRIVAPTMIMPIMLQDCTVPRATARMVVQSMVPCFAATQKAPYTPRAAASVGVATPAYIEPITQTIRNIAGASSFSAATRAENGRLRS